MASDLRPQPTGADASSAATRAGVFFALAAYGLWGLFPLYFRAVRSVSPEEVLAHRIIWSAAFLLLLVTARRNWPAMMNALRCRRTLLTLCVTTVLIAGNWFVFIWTVTNDQVMQASLGYFINPLASMLLGRVFLRERLRRWQVVSVLLAGAGVVYMTLASRQPPFIALFLAASFACYGLLRKTAKVDSLVGLAVETTLLGPLAVVFLGYEMYLGTATFMSVSVHLDLLLVMAGVLTAIPLLSFTAAARRLRLSTMGLLLYIVPTGHFLLALAFGEPLTRVRVISFVCIWAALAVYSVDAARHARTSRAPRTSPGMS